MKNYYCKRRAWQGEYWRHFQWYLRRWQQQEESCSFKIGFNSVMVMSLDSDTSSKPSQRIHEEVLFYQLISQWYQGQTVSRFQLQNFLPDVFIWGLGAGSCGLCPSPAPWSNQHQRCGICCGHSGRSQRMMILSSRFRPLPDNLTVIRCSTCRM